jgi:hypothetical protein
MTRRSPETLADYLVVGVAPALIMLLVGSLVFFLIEVFYQGQYQMRLWFVMAMFVMAIVCVARIAMEEGAGYASLFGLPLAIVVALALARFVEVKGPLAPFGQFVNWGLMALVWWAAHKLTWDCTLIDDSQDASGHGLLQELGFDRPAGAGGPGARGALAATSAPAMPATPEAMTGQTEQALPWWQTILEADRRPHAPGLWVIYFSLAALPLFGIGGWFIPAGSTDVRQRAFLFLVVYVAAGLTLLLSTSFLGLRRYLRQRRLEMPVEMTATWVGVGLILIAVTLVVCAVLPRPDGVWQLAKLPIEFTSPENQANRYAAGPEGAQENPNRPSSSAAEAQKDQQPQRQGAGQPQKGEGGNQPSDSSQSNSGNEQGEKGEPGDTGQSSEPGEKGQNGKSSNQKGKSGEQSNNRSPSNQSPSSSTTQPRDGNQNNQPQANSSSASSQTPNQPPPASSIRISSWGDAFAWVLRALFYLFLVVVLLVLVYVYREQLRAAWNKFLTELRELWARWFGKKAEPVLAAAETLPPPPRPFADFSDPFASGAAGRMTWAELVRYTFQALEAFGRESGCPRATGQTPHEFASALGQVHPALSRLSVTLADWYGQLAYASRPAPPSAIDPLRQLWQGMRGT